MNTPILHRSVSSAAAAWVLILSGCAGTTKTADQPQPADQAVATRPGEMVLVQGPAGATAKPTVATPPSAPAATTPWASPSKGGSAVAFTPRPGKWMAVINGEEVAAPEIPMGDDRTVMAILDEGGHRSKVMEHFKTLTDGGPRLTGSSNIDKADAWIQKQYKAWGLANIHHEQWGTIPVRFDRGPCSGVMLTADKPGGTLSPTRQLQFTSLSWTRGTNGAVRGPVVALPADEAEYDKVKDSIKGAWVLVLPSGNQGRFGGGMSVTYGQAKEYREAVAKAKEAKEAAPEPKTNVARAVRDGAAGFVVASRDERVITGGVGGWRAETFKSAAIPPDVVVTVCKDDGDALDAAMKEGKAVALEFNLKHTLTDGPIPVYNVIAEIPGTEKPDEVVIVSGHLDSWDGPNSQGATDNGTGTVVTMEAARILSAVHARPKRTIRFIHWSGEEQGLLGSAAYVKAHADEMPKISACLVDDGGTNYEGGIPAAECMIPYLAAATAPTNNVFYSETDKKYLNVNVRSTGVTLRVSGGSDHMSFNRMSVPGFFWDEIGRANYTHTHHTQWDRYDQGIPEYLVQSATNAAVTAYRLACAPDLLPRPPKGNEDDQPRGDRPGRPGGAPPADAPKAPPKAPTPVGSGTGTGASGQ